MIDALKTFFENYTPPAHTPSPDLKPAAVMIPLALRDDGPYVVLTKRAEHLLIHPGEICFPGGHIDKGDLSPEEAALREMHEEIGLSPTRVFILGRLEAYATISNFIITPVVGLLKNPFTYTMNTEEVAEIFEVPLAFVLNTDHYERRLHEMDDGTTRAYYVLLYGNYTIWGITAGILYDLAVLLKGQTL